MRKRSMTAAVSIRVNLSAPNRFNRRRQPVAQVFLPVTVLRRFLDNPVFDFPLPDVKTKGDKARHVIDRIFAISGVSGRVPAVP